MNYSTIIIFAEDHPSAAGHFPGNPIVPGAALLSEIARQCKNLTGHNLVSISKVKFINLLRPSQHAQLELTTDKQQAKFTISFDDKKILLGKGALA